MAKVIKMVAAFDYPNTMEKVLPIERDCRKNNRKRLQSRKSAK